MEQQTTFQNLGISESIIKRLETKNITIPTAVQKQAVPEITNGNSLIFQSETGTGKTFAYLLPLVTKTEAEENLKKEIKIVVVSPTYELASQIKGQAAVITDQKCTLLIGGAPIKRQIENLKEKPAIIVGGPARILELFKLKKLKLQGVDAVVLDEVDRLISPELRDYTIELVNIFRKDIQLIACSATITKTTEKILSETKVKADGSVASQIKTLFLPPEDVLKKRITHIAIYAESRDKTDTLRRLLSAEQPEKALVFTSRLDQVDIIASKLKFKKVNCAGLHAKMDKTERKTAIDRFRSGKCPVLITSDLASRGLDIENITHIIQMDLPSDDDFFIHRAGRTARAGKTGVNIVIGDAYEMKKFSALEKKLGITVYPKVLYNGKLVAADIYNDSESANTGRKKY